MTEQQQPTPEKKKLSLTWLLVPGILAIFIFSAYQFLNNSSTYSSYTKTYTISGWEVVHYLKHFWVWAVLGIIVGLAFIVAAYLNATGSWIGANWSGSDGLTFGLAAIGVLLIIIPWVRAFAIKANGGVDIPQTKQTSYEPKTPGSNSVDYYSDTSFLYSHDSIA